MRRIPGVALTERACVWVSLMVNKVGGMDRADICITLSPESIFSSTLSINLPNVCFLFWKGVSFLSLSLSLAFSNASFSFNCF